MQGVIQKIPTITRRQRRQREETSSLRTEFILTGQDFLCLASYGLAASWFKAFSGRFLPSYSLGDGYWTSGPAGKEAWASVYIEMVEKPLFWLR